MTESRLDKTLELYEEALNHALPTEGQEQPPVAADEHERRVSDVLVARDNVAWALRRERGVNSETLARITRLDTKLKENLQTITKTIRPAAFQNWREAIQPPETSWWWFLDRASGDNKSVPVWAILSILFAIITISLIFDTTSLIFGGGLDFVKVFGTLVQAIVALAGAGALTEIGRRWVERVIAKMGFSPESISVWRALFTFGTLILAFTMWLMLPPLAAMVYNNRGRSLQQGGLNAKAAESYQQAITLDPEYVDAHYNLALAYEDMGEYAKAIETYQRAINFDRKYYRAYNNLARLYMLRRKDYASALNYLKAEFDLNPGGQDVRYALYKNRGWAYWGLQSYDQAEQDLKEAIQLAGDPRQTHYGVAAHCLLAQVLKAKAGGDIQGECESCVAYASDPGSLDVIEATWLSFAQQCLREGSGR